MLSNCKKFIFCAIFYSFILSSIAYVTNKRVTEFARNASDDKNTSTRTDISQTSAECDCGPNSLYCKLNNYHRRRCTCEDGYAPKKEWLPSSDETCEECDCGEYGETCSFDTLGYRKCTCKPNSILLGYGHQRCAECDCGENSISCSADYKRSKRCECKYGFTFSSGDKECTKIDDYSNVKLPVGRVIIIVLPVIMGIITLAVALRLYCFNKRD